MGGVQLAPSPLCVFYTVGLNIIPTRHSLAVGSHGAGEEAPKENQGVHTLQKWRSFRLGANTGPDVWCYQRGLCDLL